MSQFGQELMYLIIVYGMLESARYCSAFLFQVCNQYQNNILPIKGGIMEEYKGNKKYYPFTKLASS